MSNKDKTSNQIRFNSSLWQAASRGLGIVVVSIAFILLDEAAGAVGHQVPLAVLLTILLMLLNCLGYAELAVNASHPDGAYTLVHDSTEGNSLAFLTGWSLILSSLGLCGLLAQGAAEHLSMLLSDLLILTVPVGPLAIGLLVLAVLQNSLGIWSSRRLTFTLPIVILLIALALVAAPHLPAIDHSARYSEPGPAVTLLIAAFIGLEIVTGQQQESRRHVANLPRALLLTLALAAVIGVGLAAAARPYAAEATGAPLASLGEIIAGTPGRITVIAAAIIVLMLALGRAMRLAAGHLYAMGQDGFWPTWLCQTHPKRGTPTRIVFLTGILAISLVWIPTDLLARASGLLYLLVLMAVNLTLAQRPRRTRSSIFRLPFHPWVPALTLAVDALVIPLWGLAPIACALGCLLAGTMVYLFYGRSRHIEAKEGITVFSPPTDEHATDRFRILVPISNPATASALLRTAGHLALFQGGNVLALQVVTVPDPVPLETASRRAEAGRTILEKALAIANQEKLPIQTMTRVAHSAAQGILDAAVEENADLIVLGWAGPTRPRGASLGKIADAVLRDAPCDVLVVRGEHADSIKKILVPTAGGPHAQAAARLATLLMKALQAKVTLLYVQQRPTTAELMEENRRRIAETLAGLSMKPPPEEKVVVAPNVTEGIIQEAQEHDLVLLGVSEESLLDQLVFGNTPLQVATRVPHTALVQGYQGLTGLWTRRVLRALRSALPALSDEERLEVHRELSQGAQPGINYFVLIVLSCIIAALGMLLDSPAVVIGAMLVGPLMSPIMALSLGLVMGNLKLIRFSVEAILKGTAMAVIIAAFIGLISPFKTVTGEMLTHSQPTLLDMAVALASGLAGAYAVARKDVSAALPGVAIAASLMPPLAALGVALSLGDMRVAGGAFLLFITNIAAISLAAGTVFLLLGIRPRRWEAESRRQLRRRLIATLLLLLAIAIPLGVIMAGIVQDTTRERVARDAITRHLEIETSQLMSLEIEERETTLLIITTVRSTQNLDKETADELAETLSELLHHPVQLEVVVLPVIRSSPTSTP